MKILDKLIAKTTLEPYKKPSELAEQTSTLPEYTTVTKTKLFTGTTYPQDGGKNVTQDINEFLDNSNISYIDLCPLSGSPRYGVKVILVYEERILVDK